MAQAKRDENFVPVLMGVSSIDLVTPTPIAVNPTTGSILNDDTSIIRDKYTTLVDDYTTINKIYIGKADANSSEASAVWQIKCIDETGNFAKIQFAEGVDTFTNIWDDRTTYTYS